MSTLVQEFTSTGSKLFWHQEAMNQLRNGKGVPIVTHIMPTDVCNFRCSFCSVQYREGDALKAEQIQNYLEQLVPLGLKATILSGGGNPLLWKDKEKDFNWLIDYIHGLGLEIGVITNGMPLVDFDGRKAWRTCTPERLDKLTWLRISLSGWDHKQDRCDTPDIDPTKTTLGGSYVLHDIYEMPQEPRHGSVSTQDDVARLNLPVTNVRKGIDRLPRLKEQMKEWADQYKPAYVRLLPNCLEPSMIAERAEILRRLANDIDPTVFFVQQKPPRQPKKCLKGYGHPVANCDGWVFACDSVVLSQTAGHKFGEQWRVCRMEDIGKFYAQTIRPNVPNNICPGCVFSDQVDLIAAIADGMPTPLPDGPPPQHINFI